MTASRRPFGRQRLGQHFLKNPTVARRIAGAVPGEAGSIVVEIGPGRGALSYPLLERGFTLLALEADPMLAQKLSEHLVGRPARVVLGDALEADLDRLLAEAGANGPVALAGNLPYESATPMIRKFVRRPDLFSSLTVMIQKEVAERILAAPGGEAYGYLSLDVGAHASCRRLFDVGPGNFDPPPKVQSTVLALTPKTPPPGAEAALLLASAGFAMRRKKLVNALESRVPKDVVERSLLDLGLPSGVRAEVMSLSDFLSLSRAIPRPGPSAPDC